MNKLTLLTIAACCLALVVVACNAEPGHYEMYQETHGTAIEEATFNDCHGSAESCEFCCTACCKRHEYTYGEEEYDEEDRTRYCHCTRYPAPFVPEVGPVLPGDHVVIDIGDLE